MIRISKYLLVFGFMVSLDVGLASDELPVKEKIRTITNTDKVCIGRIFGCSVAQFLFISCDSNRV